MIRRLRGLAAVLTILLVVLGVPLILLRVGASPIPETMPGAGEIWDALRRPDDGTLALTGFTLAAWASWVVMTFSILTELVARARGVHAPAVPGLAWPQHLARQLVGAATLLVLTVPAAAASAAPLPAGTAAVSSTTITAPAVATRTRPPAAHPPADAAQQRETVPLMDYRIQPGDTLWEIAQRHLGDGADFARILDLNRDVLGDDPGFLTPGIVLQLPATYHVQAGDTLSEIAARELGDPAAFVELADTNDIPNPDVIDVGEVLALPGAPSPPTPPPTGEGQDRDAPAPRPAHAHERPSAIPAQTSPAPQVSLSSAPTPAPQPAPPTAPSITPPAAESPAARDDGISTRTLIGLTGGGGLLAASLLTMLQRRRRRQFRARRPGRTITTPEPTLAVVESSILRIGATARPAALALDAALRQLGHACQQAGTPLPDIAAVALRPDGSITLHLAGSAAKPPPPWRSDPQTRTWTCAEAPDDIDDDLPAPWPLLATIGTGDDATTWLLNLEDQTVLVDGDATFAADWTRFVVADLGCSPWATQVHITLVGHVAGTELTDLDPARITMGETGTVDDAARQAVARAEELQQPDTPTARAALAGDDIWPAHLLVLGTRLPDLTGYLADHPGTTATGILCTTAEAHTTDPTERATTITITATGRAIINGAGLDLVAVGLTLDEAAGIAALLRSATDVRDAEIPDLDEDLDDPTGWRSFADSAGALRAGHTHPRGNACADTLALLPDPDEEYLKVAATTADDLARLAPTVTPEVSAAIQDADPTLDDDLAAWQDPTSTRPRVALLGPVTATVAGTPPDGRLAYYSEVLAYLMLRPNGATAEEVAAAFELTVKRTHTVIGVLRNWVGEHHLPDARHSPAAKIRGGAVYQIVGGLTDLDLFRRLRVRAQALGNDGVPDLIRALDLVTGPAFSQLRPGGWNWVLEGDRLDEHATVAIVDAAHIVVLDALTRDDTHAARRAAEVARLAAPYEDVPSLDLAAISRAEGDLAAAQLLVNELCTTSDDGIPDDLPERTNTILDARPSWMAGVPATPHQQAG